MPELLAPAKLNLFLHITGKRDDGYHTLQSLITFVDIGDKVSLAPQTAVGQWDSLSISGPFAAALPVTEDNLILHALKWLRRRHNPALPVFQIHLDKQLPVASGMGGGTADAAAALRLAEPWMQNATTINPTELLELGAEFPVCYQGKPLLTEGIGEVTTLWPSPPENWGVVLVNPLVPLPTKNVFQAMQPQDFLPPQHFNVPQSVADWRMLLAATENNMTRAATALVPEIDVVIQALTRTPECITARMSGSGATCFGLYPSQELAITAAESLQSESPEWWVRAGKFYGP